MGEKTRSPEEIEERIADILGYCRLDGELHDPRDFEEKYAGMRWECPDCDLTVSKRSYMRASDLQWVITPHEVPTQQGGGTSEADGTERTPAERREEKTSLLDNVQKVQNNLLGDDSLRERAKSMGLNDETPADGSTDVSGGSNGSSSDTEDEELESKGEEERQV